MNNTPNTMCNKYRCANLVDDVEIPWLLPAPVVAISHATTRVISIAPELAEGADNVLSGHRCVCDPSPCPSKVSWV